MRRKRDYFFDLPVTAIAQRPPPRRGDSRLLVVGETELADREFADILQALPERPVLVVNDSKVIPARLRGRKVSGGAVELLLVEPAEAGESTASATRWRCLGRTSKALRVGTEVLLDSRDGSSTGAIARVVEDRGDDGTLVVEIGSGSSTADTRALLDRMGELPLPPYIDRPDGTTAEDDERYQTVYAREPGAVAAPTAGLHFTDAMLASIRERGGDVVSIALHVGLGTFSPVRVDDLDEHVMHRERYSIPEATAALVASGRPVVAVGTTAVRALEASATEHGRVVAGDASTGIFIRPGYRFRVVDHLVTNFHLPESTLMMLVCAFAGYERMMAAYRHAVAVDYRFYSYGDAMLLQRREDHR